MNGRWKRDPAPERGEEAGAPVGKEGFFSRNVRVITFLVCVAIFLALFGPFSVFTIKKMIDSHDGRPALTVAEAEKLFEDPSALTFDKLLSYRGTNSETESREVCQIEFGDGAYMIYATRLKATGFFSARFYVMESGASEDILKGDPLPLLRQAEAGGAEP